MTMRLVMTNAGLAAIADATNVGTAAVRFTKLAIGTGTATGDQSARTALIAEKMKVAIAGAASGDTRIAIRADYSPTENFAVTETGLFAKIGESGAEFLAAYWVASSASGALASAASGTALVVAGVIAIESSSADLTVTPALNISVGVPDNVVLTTRHATEDRRGIVELATAAEVNAGADTERAVTPAGLAGRTATTTRRGIVELATAAEAAAGTDTERAVTPAGLAGRTATTTRRGIVELATAAEAAAGTDTERAVTPAGLAGRTATTTRKGIIEVATSAEVDAGTDTERAVTPAGVRRATGAKVSNAERTAGTEAGVRRFSPADVKAMAEAHGGRDLVLASDISLSAYTRTTHALAKPLDDFRWIGIVGGDSASDYGTYLRVPRSQISALAGSVSYLAARVTGRYFQLYSLNAKTGVLTSIGQQQALSPANIAFNGAGIVEISSTVYAVLSNDQNEKIQLYSVDTATGALTAIGAGHTIGQHPVAVGAAKSGSDVLVLIAHLSTLRLFSVNVATGVFTAIGAGVGTGQYKYGVGIAEVGGELLAATTESSADKFQLYAVDKTTGAVTARGGTHATSHGNGVALDLVNVEGALVAGISTAAGSAFRLYSVDTATGALTAIGSQQAPGVNFQGLGLGAVGSIAGGAWAGGLRLDRNGASSIGLRALSDMRAHQVIGIV